MPIAITPLIQKNGEEEEEVQRQPEEEEEKLQRQPEEEEELRKQPEEEEEKIQAKGSGKNDEKAPDDVENRMQASGTGRALPESVRSFFEPRFGYDFGGVRIHADSGAALAAKSINAQAFTHGRNIYFGSGRYSPDTSSGKMLIAHELTHVVQQNDGPLHPIVKKSISILRTKPIVQRVKDKCRFPYFTGIDGLTVNDKYWYPHDYQGPIFTDKKYELAKASSSGYNVPRSSTSNYNCMRWAVGHGEPLNREWWQGDPRTTALPWPEETYLANKGCARITANASAKHKVKLYEYKSEDQFHIVRQENDGNWSAKTGTAELWRGIQKPDEHTTSYYSQPLSNLRDSFWSCP